MTQEEIIWAIEVLTKVTNTTDNLVRHEVVNAANVKLQELIPLLNNPNNINANTTKYGPRPPVKEETDFLY